LSTKDGEGGRAGAGGARMMSGRQYCDCVAKARQGPAARKKKLGELAFAKQIKSRTTEKDRRSDDPRCPTGRSGVNAKIAIM
jgi:hypothetical protein